MAAPLAKRLQVKPGHKILAVNAPKEDARVLGELPEGARLVTRGDPAGSDHGHVFVRDSGRRGEGRMIFRQLIHDDRGCASYLVCDERAGVAAVVDPKIDVDAYLRL